MRFNAQNIVLNLLQVQEKLGLSYSSSEDLNRIIDTRLHGRAPRFKRAKVEMAGESFDLYFRDILECVRALYGNPEFARYLVFQPEKVYSEATGERLYHDMYTGKWWWTTQVRSAFFILDKCNKFTNIVEAARGRQAWCYYHSLDHLLRQSTGHHLWQQICVPCLPYHRKSPEGDSAQAVPPRPDAPCVPAYHTP